MLLPRIAPMMARRHGRDRFENSFENSRTVRLCVASRTVISRPTSVRALPRLTLGAAMSLRGKTLFISGASRGIGLAIALKAARDGANVAIAAKSDQPN